MHKIQVSAVNQWYENANPRYCVPKSISSPCPYCNELHVIFAVHHILQWTKRDDSAYAKATCPNCNKIIELWSFHYHKYPKEECIQTIEIYMCPIPTVGSAFTERLKEISPDGCDIFCQSEHAESEGLQHLSGVGYRKALEFTVKDYLIYHNPDKIEKIKGTSLADAIDMLNNENLRKIAHGVRILGNEETHYEKRVQSSDVDALKKLLHATLKHLDSELESASLAKEILDQKGKS